MSQISHEKGFETSRMLSNQFHELDPTRFTTNGINGVFAAGHRVSSDHRRYFR